MALSIEGKRVDPTPDISELALTELGDKLMAQRGYEIKKFSGALNSKDGFPQRLYAKDGRLLFVDYFATGKIPSPNQNKWFKQLSSAKGSGTSSVKMLQVWPENWTQLRESF